MTYRELQEWGYNAPVNDYGIIFSPKDERHTIKIYDDGRQMELCRVHDDYIESFRCIVFANSGIKIYDAKDHGGFDWGNPTYLTKYDIQLDYITDEFVKEFIGRGK